jgi:hypothetical protein
VEGFSDLLFVGASDVSATHGRIMPEMIIVRSHDHLIAIRELRESGGYFYMALNRRLAAAVTPTMPVPRSTMLDGSGVTVVGMIAEALPYTSVSTV